MIISYDYGHMKGGQDGAAFGILDEYKVVRDYGAVVIKYLEKAGHKCINCTPPDYSGMTLIESLQYRVNKANASGSNLHLSFHANCYNGKAYGSEIEVASNAGEQKAKPILDKICSLGFFNRGIKRPNLYVTKTNMTSNEMFLALMDSNDEKKNKVQSAKYTNAVCLLLEPFFIDNPEDVKKYNPQTLGKAIAEGILGYEIKDEITYEYAVNILKNKGIISDTAYWLNTIPNNKEVNKEYMATLIKRFVAMFKIYNTFTEVVIYCKNVGIISSPDYWIVNYNNPNIKTYNPSYCKTFIINMAKKLI